MYVNASLIREARMIYQHLFGRSFAERPSKVPQQPVQKCCFCCLLRPKRPLDSVTTIGGNAVCSDHLRFAQSDQFAGMLNNAKREEGVRK